MDAHPSQAGMDPTGQHRRHGSLDLGTLLAGKGETLGPDSSTMVHTEPGEPICRWRALEHQALTHLVNIGVGQVTARLTCEYDVAFDGERTRFQSEPYRCPNQVSIAQDIFRNGVQLVHLGAIAHHGYLISAIHHRKRHRAAMQCLSRKPERDDHRETRLSPQGFSHLLQDCEIPHQPYLICEKTFEQIRLNVELQASEAPASQHGAEAPYLLEQRLW